MNIASYKLYTLLMDQIFNICLKRTKPPYELHSTDGNNLWLVTFCDQLRTKLGFFSMYSISPHVFLKPVVALKSNGWYVMGCWLTIYII
jgi:hypothetical protein